MSADTSGGCTGACPPPPSQLRLYQTIIFATPVLFALMLLIMFCLLYFRRQALGRGATSIQSHMRAQLFVEGLLAMAPPEQGLSRSFRHRLPITLYDDSFSSKDSQCAVCLCDYQPYEKIQHLPPCNHGFHLQCIDEWLAKHVTCPICRMPLNEMTMAGAMSSDASSIGVPVRDGDARRFWEERVIGEIQDQDLPVMEEEGSEGESSHTMARFEQSMRPVVEHPIRIERS